MFRISTPGSAILEHQMKKEIAGKDARTIMETKMKVAYAQFTDPWFRGRVDVNDAMKTYKDIKRDSDRTAPETLSPEVKNVMWKRAKQLKDEFVVGMLSRDELHPIKTMQVDGSAVNIVDHERMNSLRSVERNNAWYKRNETKLVEFKNIMRHLCPDDPMASDFEKFRPYRVAHN